MKIRVMFGCVIEGTYEVNDVRHIVAMTGKEIYNSEADYILEEPMKIYNSHAYLALVTTDGKYHLYSNDNTIEFVK